MSNDNALDTNREEVKQMCRKLFDALASEPDIVVSVTALHLVLCDQWAKSIKGTAKDEFEEMCKSLGRSITALAMTCGNSLREQRQSWYAADHSHARGSGHQRNNG